MIFMAPFKVREFSGKVAATSLCACGSVRAGVFFKLDSKSQHKMQPKKNVDHMAMPGWPGAMFIMIHPQLAFSFFEALLDGPSHDRGLAHLRERHIDGCIGEGEFGLSIKSASDKEPYRILPWSGLIDLRQPISGWIDSEAGHLSDNRFLGAFGQDNGLPVAFGRASKHGYGFGLGLTGRKSRQFGFSSPSRVSRESHLRLFEKDLSIGAHIGEVVGAFG